MNLKEQVKKKIDKQYKSIEGIIDELINEFTRYPIKQLSVVINEGTATVTNNIGHSGARLFLDMDVAVRIKRSIGPDRELVRGIRIGEDGKIYDRSEKGNFGMKEIPMNKFLISLIREYVGDTLIPRREEPNNNILTTIEVQSLPEFKIEHIVSIMDFMKRHPSNLKMYHRGSFEDEKTLRSYLSNEMWSRLA